MSRRFLGNVKVVAKNLQVINTLYLLRMGKFSAIVRPDYIRCITKVEERTLYKVYGVLVEIFSICTHIADNWHIFHIPLPLFPIPLAYHRPQLLGFLPGRFRPLAVAEPDKHTLQRSRMLAVGAV